MNAKLKEKDKKLILELKDLLVKKHGSLIHQILCYGSKVYVQKEDADFDILIITDRKITWQEEDKVFEDILKFGITNDTFFDVKFFSREEVLIEYKQMPFLKNVLSYGIPV